MRKAKYSHKVIAMFLAINIFQSILPYNLLYASNNGPNAPEASGFEPVNATDMVNLASGDMAYVLPLMDVDGFPISLSYHDGIAMDLESTWTGLGWNLNTGAINRNQNATPDDWNGGNSLDFIRYQEIEEYYNVNVGVGIATAAEVGIGASWGSNKAMTGSVFANLGYENFGASARIDTDGNYTLGVSAGTGKAGEDSFGGGVSMSGNIGGGKTTFGAGIGVRAGGMTIGVGASLDGSSMGMSIGGSNGNSVGSGKAQSGAVSLSTSSFSKGDWKITSEGFYIPIQVYFFSFGFGRQKVKYTLKKAFNKQGYGILYSNNVGGSIQSEGVDGDFNDYQNRYRYTDTYDQSLPESEQEFIGDYDAEREKINFTYAAYDSYQVNGVGISGELMPKILQNSTVFGLGYSGPDPNVDDGKLRIYNHNSLTTDKAITYNGIRFYFNGQFTQNVLPNGRLSQASPEHDPLTPLYNNNNSLAGILTSRGAMQNPRLRQGNYTEVYTNRQIANGAAEGLLLPVDPDSNGLSLNPTSHRGNNLKYPQDGIGGYKITAADGKVYHFSQPVYHYEMVERNILKDNTQEHVSEKRQYSSYATHWLLTAITGPDYMDTNNNKMADAEDYGYWVRMDYGKWSEGYVWRNPTDKNLVDYNTNIYNRIGEKDFGTYQFGRKQLLYLDRVVTANHTAYFVKKLRYDSAGSNLTYAYTPNLLMTNNGTSELEHPASPSFPHVRPHENFSYSQQMQLVLDKIVLVKNTRPTVSKGNNGDSYLNIHGVPNYASSYTPLFATTGGFYRENLAYYQQTNPEPMIKMNYEQGVYDTHDFVNFNYNDALKVVKLNYNYNLAVRDHTNTNNSNPAKSAGSPGTVECIANPNYGKLCLKSVQFLGRGNFDYMPPYEFEYKGEYQNGNQDYIMYPPNAIKQKRTYRYDDNGNILIGPDGLPVYNYTEIPIEDIRAKDEWGFLKEENRADAWSLTRIKTPTGSKLTFEREEDDFYTEAFSRRYWTTNLRFRVISLGVQEIKLVIDNELGLVPGFEISDFRDYFGVNDQVFLDMWVCRNDRGDKAKIDINDRNTCWITEVNQNSIEVTLNRVPSIYEPIIGNLNAIIDCGTFCTNNGHENLLSGVYISQENCGNYNSAASNINEYLGRNGCPGNDNNSDHWTLTYKLLATRVPSNETGGGTRIKSITVNDEVGNKYRTNYYYNMPGTNRNKGVGDYKSSGITSYSPVKGQKYIPYQSELPSPGVMYEYVTMAIQADNGESLGETRYRFHVLRPVIDIFSKNIEMKDDDGVAIFKAHVDDHVTSNGYLNPAKKIKAKSIKVDVNTSMIGQFRSIEEFNSVGQLMSKVENKYLSGLPLKEANINKGSITESFQSMKSVFKTDEDDSDPILQQRYLSVSTKEEYTSVLQSITKTDMHGKTIESYSETDPETGNFLVVETKKSDGTVKRVQRVPAYTKYPIMGPIRSGSGNRNMLAQEAMVFTSIQKPDLSWKTINANITTWNNDWTYRDYKGEEYTPSDPDKVGVYRKHKSYVWKEDSTNPDGTFPTTVNALNNYFNWAWPGTPTNNSWKKISEITRYNHFSSPLETKDINQNFAASKLADQDSKVIVSGNARYTEMYYSGAENIELGNYYAGEVLGAQYRSSDIAHTGLYSSKATAMGDKVFEVTGSSGKENYYTSNSPYNQTFRPGKYKVSFWAYKQGSDLDRPSIPIDNQTTSSNLIVNDVPIAVSEIIEAGCWQQLNYYFNIPAERVKNTIVVTPIQYTGSNYYDDFRMHPIASTINSYVYDENTDELTYSLNNNNMATGYRYDKAGRLLATYVEDIDNSTTVGGLKLVSQVKQQYKGMTVNQTFQSAKIQNCELNTKKLKVEVQNQHVNSYENKFEIKATGGSGNYEYSYKWLTNAANRVFSNYTQGSNIFNIPFVPDYCEQNQTMGTGVFAKRWSFIVKVKDVMTNVELEESYDYKGDCINKKYYNLDSDIQITDKQQCPLEKFNFKVYMKDKIEGNFKYEYALYNPNTSFNDQNLQWINATNSNGEFCPTYSKIEDSKSVTGYRKVVYFTYRVTDLSTGEISNYLPNVFFGEDAQSNENLQILPVIMSDKEYQRTGMQIIKNKNGEIISFFNRL